jgi:hypothetical protein
MRLEALGLEMTLIQELMDQVISQAVHRSQAAAEESAWPR